MSAIERFLYRYVRPRTESYPRVHAALRSVFDTVYRRSVLSPEYRALKHIRALERFAKGRLPVTISSNGSYAEQQGVRFRVGDLSDGTYGAPPPATTYEEAAYVRFLEKLRGRKRDALTIIDIGANVGSIALRLAADTKPKRTTVYAIEPSRRTFAVLEDNQSLNPALDVRPRRLALSDTDGTVSLTSDGGTGNHLVRSGSARSERVKAQTVDSFCRSERIPRVDGIKIDVEGAELLVLKGADGVLARDGPSIMIEIQDEWTRRFGYRAVDVFTYLRDAGYSCTTGQGIVIASKEAFARIARTEYNFIFSPRKTA